MLDVVRVEGQTILFPARDAGMGACLRQNGDFAKPEQDLIVAYLDALEPGSFVDAGANIGMICVPVAGRRPDVRIVAVEAQRQLSHVLAANILNNQAYNIDMFNVAIGATEGQAEFPSIGIGAHQNFAVVGFKHAGRVAGETVRVVPLDDLAPPDTRLIKLDVEGHEVDALRGASRLLAERQAIWLVEANRNSPDSAARTAALLADAGYRLFWFYSPIATPASPRPATSGLPGDFSILALPPQTPNLWDLPPVDAAALDWPVAKSLYGYLARYAGPSARA